MTEQPTTPTASITPAQHAALMAIAARAAADGTVRDERSRRKAAWVRAAIYIAGTHFFAFFVMLLFFLGNHH
ncbi:hypothetical protein C7C46_04720 [Streptomyces tateyamensis]|uniref:Small hydrophobic protein n=1 Tax=Streptomyces tateyamensis TaxID=565073 RepID=A0A2V4PR06_9ACTN|nr:DUF6126 family protein [Streptomyces tateyamensis]PYC87387.1 hypothetical protein C7C46_04720 [Streptomyces tateyamensis]